MFYLYNKNSLSFEKVSYHKLIFPIIFICGFAFMSFKAYVNDVKEEGYIEALNQPIEEAIFAVAAEEDAFSQEALVKELKKLNVRFPEIILAQSILETGHYSSRIFEENNNLFGMKQARARSTTALGTQLGHAYYDNWKESVMDYALFQNAYMNKIRKEKQYLHYLNKNYAEAKNYDKTLLEIIEREKLRELFLD